MTAVIFMPKFEFDFNRSHAVCGKCHGLFMNQTRLIMAVISLNRGSPCSSWFIVYLMQADRLAQSLIYTEVENIRFQHATRQENFAHIQVVLFNSQPLNSIATNFYRCDKISVTRKRPQIITKRIYLFI